MTYDKAKAEVFRLLVPKVGSDVRVGSCVWVVRSVDFGMVTLAGLLSWEVKVPLRRIWKCNRFLTRDWVLSGPHECDMWGDFEDADDSDIR